MIANVTRPIPSPGWGGPGGGGIACVFPVSARFPVAIFVYAFLGWTFDFYDLVLLGFLRDVVGRDLGMSQSAEWWLLGIAMWRTRGGRRGLWVALTVFIGMVLAWASAESLKHVFQRERPFLAIPDALKPLIIEPGSYSFPSGDTALAFGAAVAFGQCFPRFRPFALLLAFAVGLSRVFVGVHYPLDALGGAIVGVVWGLLAPPIVAWVLRRLIFPLGRPYVVPSDKLGHEVARLLIEPSATRDRLTAGMYLSNDPEDALNILERALVASIAAQPIEMKIRAALRAALPTLLRE